MNAFHGYYEISMCSCRHFATLYLALRFFNLFVSVMVNSSFHHPLALVLLVRFCSFYSESTIQVIIGDLCNPYFLFCVPLTNVQLKFSVYLHGS